MVSNVQPLYSPYLCQFTCNPLIIVLREFYQNPKTNFVNLTILDPGPSDGDTITISDGTQTVILTFKAVPQSNGLELPLHNNPNYPTIADYRQHVADWLLSTEFFLCNFSITAGGNFVNMYPYGEKIFTFEVNGSNIIGGVNNQTFSLNPPNLCAALKVKVWPGSSTGTGTSVSVYNLTGSFGDQGAPFDISKLMATSLDLPNRYTICGNYFSFYFTENIVYKYQLYWAEKSGSPQTTKSFLTDNVTYYAVHGGVRHKDICKTFFNENNDFTLLRNWRDECGEIIWKKVSCDQPDWTYVFVKEELQGFQMFYTIDYEDGTSYTGLINNNLTIAAGQVYWFTSGPGNMGVADVFWENAVRYRISFIGGNTLKDIYYEIDCECAPFNCCIGFDNGVGGFESINLRGKKYNSYSVKRDLHEKQVLELDFDDDETFTWSRKLYNKTEQSNVKGYQFFEVSTGWYCKEMIQNLRKLMLADLWIIDKKACEFIPIIMDTNSLKIEEDDQELFALTFKFRFTTSDCSWTNLP